MPRALVGWIAIAVAGVGYIRAGGLQSSRSPTSSTEPPREVLDRYCVVFHNERLKTVGPNLSPNIHFGIVVH